ncbi:hypothetical protein JOF28_001318 [Leucobacter exalbidus]|uniref:Glycosyltransferase 2-like domain-containing protein n=1 Tax=Leucobacter exalbidus TaxID=662960 RepID=A0A940T5K4_9MICO|nr:glycosyltransferase family 2 protein [Leucobacter exalbidus]MBP1326086.1 hypothetical protein [Leucobacter exalbidus]
MSLSLQARPASFVSTVPRKISNRVYRILHGHRFAPELPAKSGEAPTRRNDQGQPEVGSRQYRQLHGRSHRAIYRLGAGLLSTDAVEMLARQGTKGRYDWAGLKEIIQQDRRRLLPADWFLQPTLFAVFLNHLIEFTPESLKLTVAALHQSARHQQIGKVSANPTLWRMSLQAAAIAKDAPLYRALVRVRPPEGTDVGWAAGLDLARPTSWKSSGESASVKNWWAGINTPYVDSNVEPWELEFPDAEPYGRLFELIRTPKVLPLDLPADAPMVTIVVPCYNPAPSLIETIRSACLQTWSNLEVIIVDDASTSGLEFITQAAEQDDRVRIIRQPKNGGAYLARNAGMRAAKGDFVTVLDADDLNHPRRLEVQLKPLLENEQLIGTVSRSLCISPAGYVTDFGSSAIVPNLSTMLIRREAVLTQVGFYDRVRKAGDREFVERIRTVFGEDAVLTMRESLAMIQLTTGSLSRAELRGGADWISGPRLAYRAQLRGWHASLAETAADLLPISDEPSERPFVAPAKLLGLTPSETLSHVFLGDWSPRSESMDAQLECVRGIQPQSTDRMGILRAVNPRFTRSAAGKTSAATRVWDLVENQQLEWVAWEQEATVEHLVVTDPECLIFLPNPQAIKLSIQKITIHVPSTNAANSDSGEPLAFDQTWLSAQCQRSFGVTPEWGTA